jgi:ribonuclease P protein component
MDQRFGRERRLHSRPEFTRAYDGGDKRHGRFIIVFLFPTARPTSRLGVAVTRKFGGAVRRNRAKRWLREIFRRLEPRPGLDVIIVPKREFPDASFAALDADIRSVLARGADARPRVARQGRTRGPRGRARGAAGV